MLMWQALMHTQNKAQQAIRLKLWLLVIYLVVCIRFKKVKSRIGYRLAAIALFQKIGTVVAIRDKRQFEPRRSDELKTNLSRTVQKWPQPRAAIKNSFASGWTNATLVVTEYR
ncbi:hypothetical protein NECAME_06238 [Necator americanus]|uniref:Uncharacterized protein n=1 Tax=Necator americanus TaxID=51031 RepID=W2TUE9_NECAM|nr:hypothetical protein NECAME_06238 [Necator americanus]ETN85725.1 hypothetical protein NECAME_06238 [Necator americanus]